MNIGTTTRYRYNLDVRAVNNYYPFGMLMPDMSWQSNGYRYGYNGMEMYNDIKGTGNHLSTYFRGLDPRVGRWGSADPAEKSFPGRSSYISMGNNPINMIDPLGDAEYYNSGGDWVASDNENNEKVYKADAGGAKVFGIGILKENSYTEWNYEIKDPKFASYYLVLLEHEGGYSNRKTDRGGETNLGITINTFIKYSSELLGINPTSENLKRLQPVQAAKIYELKYWNSNNIDEIQDEKIGALLFDTYVNGGGSKVLKNTIIQYGESSFNIKTLNKLINEQGAKNVFNTIKDERIKYYHNILKRDATQKANIKGWENRIRGFKYD